MSAHKFKSGVAEQLDHYVYLLVDPRNGQTFYIGRGKENRLFAHINASLVPEQNESEESLKLKLIREIRRTFLEPVHIIHRHKLTEKEAKEVESALIDYTPGLTNVVSGYGNDRGPTSADELNHRYAREVMIPNPNHKLLYIKVRDDGERDLYDAVRGSWNLKPERAERADYIIAVYRNICRGVFKAEKNGWSFVGKDDKGRNRYEFRGHEILNDVAKGYNNRLIPDDKRGQATVQYNYI